MNIGLRKMGWCSIVLLVFAACSRTPNGNGSALMPDERVNGGTSSTKKAGSEIFVDEDSSGKSDGAVNIKGGSGSKSLPNSFTQISNSGAPDARSGHTAVWTGSELIVWGGSGAGNVYLNSGGRYNPVTNSWKPTSLINAPSARVCFSAVWTGSRMIIFGGLYFSNFSVQYLSDGASYDPKTDTWTKISTQGAPAYGKANHSAVWTGKEMVVWGGWPGDGGMNPDGSTRGGGAIYNPETDTWRPMTNTNAPIVAGQSRPTIWTGSKMIVWGGTQFQLNTGGIYDPQSDTWTNISTAGAPEARMNHTIVWSGSKMLAYGGYVYENGGARALDSGGIYDPSTNLWTEMKPGPKRAVHSAVFVKGKMLLVGGYDETHVRHDGSAYDLASNSWSSINMDGLTAFLGNSVTSTGSQMLVWGGMVDNYTIYTPVPAGIVYQP